MMRRGAAAALLLGALVAARASFADAPAAASFDYLYVRAHEASASGGHAALRFGADSFDFQHRDGWVVMRREDSRRFQHHYRALQNRSIEVSRVAATPDTVALLRESFERRLIAQTRQHELLGELEADVALLDALAGGAAPSVAVRGAGFFAGAEDGADAPAALPELRARIAERHGAGWLAARCADAERALHELAPAPQDVAALRADPLALPFADDSLTRRSGRALAARTACEVLAHPRGLRAGVRAGEGLEPDPWLALDGPMRARLHEIRAALLDAATALAASRRPDWGEALLLAGARLVALDESLAAGRLIVLDALPADAKPLRIGARRRALLPTLQGDARKDVLAARQGVFAGDGFRETAWGELEAAVTRNAELRAAERGASRLRVASGPLLPAGVARLPLAPRPDASRSELARAADAARAVARAYRAQLEAQYRYNVVGRNCVSELFRTIEIALAAAPGAPPAEDAAALRAFVAQESQRRLGGYIDPVAAANFVPFVSSRHVRASWRVAERIHLDSVREHAIGREGTALAALRESNVVTSTVYEPAERAGFFVFFTDGAAWPLRPLLGAANLVAALARSGVGVLQLPFDRGEGLRAGLDGALWSAPELLFVNIRKGSNEYVPPAQRPPPG